MVKIIMSAILALLFGLSVPTPVASDSPVVDACEVQGGPGGGC
jgi:hypothetical protein